MTYPSGQEGEIKGSVFVTSHRNPVIHHCFTYTFLLDCKCGVRSTLPPRRKYYLRLVNYHATDTHIPVVRSTEHIECDSYPCAMANPSAYLLNSARCV